MMKTVLIIFFFVSSLFAQVKFEKYFTDHSLRVDYYHSGNSKHEFITFDEMIKEPYWGGSEVNLIDTFHYGAYMFKVFDAATDSLIYSHGYSTLFREWQTTGEAKKINRSFSESLVFPFPKDSVIVEIFSRDRKNIYYKIFHLFINPKNYFIKQDNRKQFPSFKVFYSGNPHKKLDIVFIPDGYTKDQMSDFKKDCVRFKNYLFDYLPFSKNKNKINIWGVEAVSKDSGADIPAVHQWKRTVLGTSYYTFNSERYLMTYNDKAVRDVAANVPYDQIYILVNSKKYGGGAIYNYYSVAAAKNKKAKQLFIHEFGHGFGGLADEYYNSSVSYENFYPLDVEPWEPNITTLVNFAGKWKDMIKPGTPIPTPDTKKYDNVIGVFQGGGYAAKGIYRPSRNSIMKSFSSNKFNAVSKRALQRMINFYAK